MARGNRPVDVSAFVGKQGRIILLYEVTNNVNERVGESPYSSFHLDREIAFHEKNLGEEHLKLYVADRFAVKIDEHLFPLEYGFAIKITNPKKILKKVKERALAEERTTKHIARSIGFPDILHLRFD